MQYLLMLVLLWGKPAWAIDEADQARAVELFSNGRELYEEGQYNAAIMAFKEGYEISELPAFLFNIANAYERLGDLDQAIDYLNQYRAYASNDERDSLERRIKTLEQRQENENAQIGPTPTPTPTPVPTRGKHVAGWTMVGVGGGVAIIGGAVAGITYSRSLTLRDEGTTEAQEEYENLRPINTASLVAAGVGAGVAVLGGVGIAADFLTVSPTPGGGHIEFRWRF